MSWTVALPEGAEAGLRALVDGRIVVATEQADVVLWPVDRRGAMPVGVGLNVIDLRGVDPAAEVALDGAGLLLVGSAAAYGAWAARVDVPIGVVPAVVEAAVGASERFEALHLLVGQGEIEAAEQAAIWAAARGMNCGVAEGHSMSWPRLGWRR